MAVKVSIALIALTIISISASLQNDTICRPFPVMVPTGSEIYFDSFIIVHQCRGRSKEAINSNIQCVNTTAKSIGRFIGGVEVYNHTNCSFARVCNKDLNEGEKPDPTTRSGVCYFHERWNKDDCKCESKNKSCKDDTIRSSTNKGFNSSSSIGLDLFIIALFGELFVMMSIVYIIWRLKTRQKSNNYDVNESVPLERNECNCISSKPQQGHKEETDV